MLFRSRKASADAPFVEERAGFVVVGVCLFDKNDWTRHCRALIGLLDDSEGAVLRMAQVSEAKSR